MRYEKWLEKTILSTDTEWLCEELSEVEPEWCEKNCDGPQPKCLKKKYEVEET